MVATATTKPQVVQAPPEKSGRSKWRNIAAFVACQLAAIMLVEGVLFAAGLGEEEIFKFDPEIGFTHMTNKRITWRTEGFAQSYLNEDGMREPGLTVAKPANTYRIALLGDSMVEGYQVPIEETFGAVAGKQLGTLDGKAVQVLNFGTSGYSTAQEFLQLKRQVMKYQPDLVVLSYNSRDLFENWSPPDEVITNVRPAAIHLPGGALTVDSTPVRRWFNTPRARFMRSIEWVREHSRIYGLFAAIDLEWSQHNPWYKAAINSLSKPKNTFAEFQKAMATEKQKGPSWDIHFFEDTKPKHTTAIKAPDAAQHVFISAASNDSLSAAKQIPTEKAVMPETMYTKLVTHTLTSLLQEMRTVCNQGDAKLVVMSLPVRAQLCPLVGMETKFGEIDYPQELDAITKICASENIPFLNVEAKAETLPLENREALFHVVHLSPTGHQFIADQISPFIKNQLTNH